MSPWKKILKEKKEIILVIVLWIILTGININKAYHIDDTFHLKAAEYILDHPLSPMSGLVNWGEDPAPLHTHNQPPLFFFLLALVIKLFGDNEIYTHLLISLFTFAALFWFYKITELMQMKKNMMLVTVFAFCPAFIVNQNLMVDVPVLAVILGTLFYILKEKKQNSLRNHFIAAVLLSTGLLIKYTLLPILVVFIIIALISKDYKKIIIAMIPLLILVLWSVWNYFEYGAIHLIDRPKTGFKPIRAYEFIACLGALSAFVPTFLYGSIPKKVTKYMLYGVFAFYAVLSTLKYFNAAKFPTSVDLNYSFVVTGSVILISILLIIGKSIRNETFKFVKSDKMIILLYALSISTFIIFFSPFIATRHILLIIPLLLLIGYEFFERADKYINRLTVISTIFLGLALGISDRVYADFYRKTAGMVKIGTTQNIWSLGHWGWQWYSEKAGMKIYSRNDISVIKSGDHIVFPKDVHKQEIHPNIKIQIIDKITLPSDLLTYFSGKHFASMYKSEYNKPPWRLSNETCDTIIVAKVMSVSE